MTITRALERELAEAREALREREAELSASRRQVADLSQELQETNRGLIALHAELEEVRQAEARLAAIVEWSGDAMFSMGTDAVIQTWNPGAERLLGYQAAEMTGRAATVLMPTGLMEEFTALMELARAGDPGNGYETRCLRKDGSALDAAVTCSAMRDASGVVTGFSVVLRDITARLAAEAELAATRAAQEVLAERDRMARDLHDRVIQRIFAAGLTLQTAASVVRQPEAARRIEAVIGDLDTSIAEIRETIFTLRHPRREPARLHGEVLALVSQVAPALGFTPAVSFDGAERGIPDDVSGQLLAVLREALSNIARHARASAAAVALTTGSELLLQISDNGCGLGEVTRSSGLRNMRERAELLGGTFRVAGEPGAGTRLEWCVPLH